MVVAIGPDSPWCYKAVGLSRYVIRDQSGRDGASNASKRLETAAAEPVCGQNLQLLGSMDARRAADAGRRAVFGQIVITLDSTSVVRGSGRIAPKNVRFEKFELWANTQPGRL